MRFTVKNKNIFLVPNNKHMIHLGTIGYGLREFIVMVNRYNQKCYIEELVLNSFSFTEDITANCKFIDDENLAFDLAKFAEDNKITDLHERLNELNDLDNLSYIIKS